MYDNAYTIGTSQNCTRFSKDLAKLIDDRLDNLLLQRSMPINCFVLLCFMCMSETLLLCTVYLQVGPFLFIQCLDAGMFSFILCWVCCHFLCFARFWLIHICSHH